LSSVHTKKNILTTMHHSLILLTNQQVSHAKLFPGQWRIMT
jgi:hypothetical protein